MTGLRIRMRHPRNRVVALMIGLICAGAVYISMTHRAYRAYRSEIQHRKIQASDLQQIQSSNTLIRTVLDTSTSRETHDTAARMMAVESKLKSIGLDDRLRQLVPGETRQIAGREVHEMTLRVAPVAPEFLDDLINAMEKQPYPLIIRDFDIVRGNSGNVIDLRLTVQIWESPVSPG